MLEDGGGVVRSRRAGARPRPSPSRSRRSRRRRRRPPRRWRRVGRHRPFPPRDVYVVPRPVPVLVLVLRFVLRFVLRPGCRRRGRLGCRVGTIGPITGQPRSVHRVPGFDSTGSVGRGVRCVAPGNGAGTYPVVLAPLPGASRTPGTKTKTRPRSPTRRPRRRRRPATDPVRPARRRRRFFVRQSKDAVVSGDASLVPVAFAAAEARRGDGPERREVRRGRRVGRCRTIVGRRRRRARRAQRWLVASSRRRPLRRQLSPPGFTVVHVAGRGGP